MVNKRRAERLAEVGLTARPTENGAIKLAAMEPLSAFCQSDGMQWTTEWYACGELRRNGSYHMTLAQSDTPLEVDAIHFMDGNDGEMGLRDWHTEAVNRLQKHYALLGDEVELVVS